MQETHDFDGEHLVSERQREILEIMWAFKKPMTTAQVRMAMENLNGHTIARNTTLEHLKALHRGGHIKQGNSAPQFLWSPTRQKLSFIKSTADFKPRGGSHSESIISHGMRQIEVLELFWASSKPLIVRDILDGINKKQPKDKQLAYTTILTITRNLFKRRSLLRHGVDNGRNHLYVCAYTREDFYHKLMRAHRALFFGGDGKLMIKMLKREYK